MKNIFLEKINPEISDLELEIPDSRPEIRILREKTSLGTSSHVWKLDFFIYHDEKTFLKKMMGTTVKGTSIRV